MYFLFATRKESRQNSLCSIWMIVAALFSVLVVLLGERFIIETMSSNLVTEPSTLSFMPPSRPMNPLLHEPESLSPWENASCWKTPPSPASVNTSKNMLTHQPLVLLDIALFVILKTHPSGSAVFSFLPRTGFLSRTFAWSWIRRPKRHTIFAWSRPVRKSFRYMFKIIGRVYKNRSRLSTLSDYTWYMGSSATSTTQDDS